MKTDYDEVVSPASPYQSKYLNCNSRIQIAGGSFGCVDAATEYLGENGWVKISDYVEGERIFSYCAETDSINIETPEYVKEYGTTLYRLHNEDIDMVLSMNHNILYYSGLDINKPLNIDTETLVKEYNNNKDIRGFVKYFDGINLGMTDFSGYQIEEFIPKDLKQYCFVTETGYFVARRNGKCFITGNSSKSYVGLMRHLRWADDPYYRGVVVRKNMKPIKASGGLYDEAVAMYRKVYPDLRTTLEPRKIIFPSGAVVEFHHYESDKAGENFRGLNLSGAFYDEATHSEEDHIWWINSRLRNTQCKTKYKSIWITLNPDPDAWVLTSGYLDYYIHPEGHPKAGLPDPERNGHERYLVRIAGKVHFAATAQELIDKFGKSIRPLTYTVLLGTVYDNPVLLEKSPEYLDNLKSMNEIDMRRNLLGDWFARPEGSNFFDRNWIEEIIDDVDPNEVVSTVRAYDFAGTLVSDINTAPDYTACVKMSKLKDGTYVIRDAKRTRIRFGDWQNFIISNAMEDIEESPRVTICLPISPNPESKAATIMMARELGGQGLVVETLQATGNNSKLDGFRPLAALSQNGGVKILKDCMLDVDVDVRDNDILYKEFELFDGTRSTRNRKDDLVDCAAGAFRILATLKTLPNISAGLAGNLTMNDNSPLRKLH